MKQERITALASRSAKMGLVPLLFYFGLFCALTYPEVTRFPAYLFADGGDGLQNVWNLWWVREAVTQLRQSPWKTSYLHWPYGTTLLGHTLNPFNGFLGIPLSGFMTLTQTYNFIVVFSFVVGGLTAFLLANYLTGSYLPSLIAGFIFTFSSYHFAHAQGHLQLISLEWIPLFILLWLRLLSRPTVQLAVGAAAVLFFVILCDYYYFLYCVLTAVIIFGWRLAGERRAPRPAKKGAPLPLVVFCCLAAATSGTLVGCLVSLELKDPLTGAHSPQEFSLDVLAPFIYGGHWRFASLTQPIWSKLPGGINENSVHLGLSVLVLLVYAWRKRRVAEVEGVKPWFYILLVFVVLALGPTLHVWGRVVPGITLPYAWLAAIFPLLKLSGVPIRMMVMVMLSAAVISAYGLKLLFRGSRRERALAAALLGLLFFEYLPKPIPTLKPEVPGYVRELKGLPGPGGILDTVSYYTLALFYQTVHQKPMAFGYLARLPSSVVAKDRALARTVEKEDFSALWRGYHIRYVVTQRPQDFRNSPGVRPAWTDGHVWIFDLAGAEPPRDANRALEGPGAPDRPAVLFFGR